MSRVAAINVTIRDRCFLAGDEVPDEYAKSITDDGVWAGAHKPAKSQEPVAVVTSSTDDGSGTEAKADDADATAPTVKVRRKGSK